ncbi:MAG: hypothetical protein R8M46_00150 [Ghiorsea sp.]
MNKHFLGCIGFMATGLMLAAVPAQAETAIDFGITSGVQGISPEADKVDTYGAGSVDLSIDMELGGGIFHLYLEGASDAAGTAAEVIDGASLDVGTAADELGKGRGQVSELSYGLGFSGYSVSVGMQNLFAFSDANSTSNSETDQFMAASLVNNPTIAMPDYTISAVLNYGYPDRTNATFMVANAYGLADNTSKNYQDLVDFGKTDAGLDKGVFALGELRLEDQDVWMTIGAWTNTREDNPLAGAYVNLDSASDESFSWSVRVGQNDEVADNVSLFGSFTTAYAVGDDVLGVGIAVQKLDAPTSTHDDVALLETYYRWQFAESWALTPDVQVWKNANGLIDTDAATGTVGGDVVVYGLRLQFGADTTF